MPRRSQRFRPTTRSLQTRKSSASFRLASLACRTVARSPSLISHTRALACLLHCKSNDILSSTDPIEYRKAAGQHVEQIFAIGGRLPIFAHRDVGHVLPQLQLELGANPPLRVEVAGVEPGAAQCFDPRARRPAIPGGKPIGAYQIVAVGVGV